MKTDAELTALLCDHADTAIAELQQKYGGLCYHMAYQILQCREDAEECVNDVFLHCWESVPRQRPTYFRAYLRTMTRNLAISRFRSRHMQKRGGEFGHIALEECEMASAENLDAEICDGLVIRQCLDRSLSRRPAQDKRMFLRRYRDEAPISALMEEFSLNENCIKSRLMRMRRALHRELTREGVLT